MYCSSCSAPIRPVVAIDIDGTLGDYHTHFLNFAQDWIGHRLADGLVWGYDGREPFREWCCSVFSIDVTTFRQIKLAYRQGGLKRTMPPYPGAAEMIVSLAARAEVWLTTTRPWERYDRVDPDTREWCRRWHIEFDALLFDEGKVQELADRVSPGRVAALLDDQREELDDAIALGIPAIKHVTRYNMADGWEGSEAANLGAAYKMINDALDDWARRNR